MFCYLCMCPCLCGSESKEEYAVVFQMTCNNQSSELRKVHVNTLVENDDYTQEHLINQYFCSWCTICERQTFLKVKTNIRCTFEDLSYIFTLFCQFNYALILNVPVSF